MGKFTALSSDIYSIFGTEAWTAEGITARPENFVAINNLSEFIRINIIPGSSGINLNSVSGLLLIEIFIPAGKGTKRAFQIADILDTHLVGKSVSTVQGAVVQFGKSTCAPNGKDKEDDNLYVYEYNTPFNYFGVN